MRVNIYAEEMTDRVEIIAKEIDGHKFTGLRIYLELPATVEGKQYQGPFTHRPGDDDSSAVTFWGKRDLRDVLRKALHQLDAHYASRNAPADPNAKRPRLLYWEDAEDAWCPADGLEVDNIISTDLFLADGDIEEIRFKRQDMTDAEFAAIPEG